MSIIEQDWNSMGNTHKKWQMRLSEIKKLLYRRGKPQQSEESTHRVERVSLQIVSYSTYEGLSTLDQITRSINWLMNWKDGSQKEKHKGLINICKCVQYSYL